MKIKIKKWYSSLCFSARMSLFIFLFSLFFSLLAYIGIQSEYISQINKSNVDESLTRGFLYSLKFLFVNEKNKLNWVGISAVGVLISYVINSKFNRDKLRADLVSTSRMKWLDNVKEITSCFIKDVSLFNAKHILFLNKANLNNNDKLNLQIAEQEYFSIIDKGEIPSAILKHNVEILRKSFDASDKSCGSLAEELNDIQFRIIKNYLLIKMNFGKEKEDKKIIRMCKDITEDLKDSVIRTSNIQDESRISNFVIVSENKNGYREKELDKLANVLKAYYKTEWEKVKKGE